MNMEHPLLLNISVLFEVNGLRAERHLYIQDRYMRGQRVGLLAGTSLFKTVLTSPYLCFPSSVKRKGRGSGETVGRDSPFPLFP